MIERDSKEVFKEKLADTHIDWQEYCMLLIDVTVEAETREKDFCDDSRWWYNRMTELDQCLTDGQQEYFGDVYEAWIEKKDK